MGPRVYGSVSGQVGAPSGCLLGGGLELPWTMEEPGLAPGGEEECPLD